MDFDVEPIEWPHCHPKHLKPLQRRLVTDLFFDPAREEEAKELCFDCPFRASCLQKALDRNEPEGVWGGFNFVERRLYTRIFGDDDGKVDVGDAVQELPVKVFKRRSVPSAVA